VHRESLDAARPRDSYESDDGLQRRCARVYDQLAAVSWLSPWRVLDGTSGMSLAEVAAEIVALR
jgi:dTMP kinase